MQFIHKIGVHAYQVQEDQIVGINHVDKNVQAGDWVVTYPDGKQAVVSDEQHKAEFEEVEPGIEHVVTDADIEANPGEELTLGEKVIIPSNQIDTDGAPFSANGQH